MQPPRYGHGNAQEHSASRTLTGRLSVHQRGFGFLAYTDPDTGAARSAFVPPAELQSLLDDDEVEATVYDQDDGRQAVRSLRLQKRSRTTLYGEAVIRRGQWFLKTDRDVCAVDWPLQSAEPLSPGEPIVARIEGALTVLARRLSGEADRGLVQLVLRHGLRTEFEPEALAEAESAASKGHTLGHRRDLRELATLTVDAPSTRDLDDALTVLPADPDGALRLLVSIADPAEFVTEGSALDASARARATSSYLTGSVLPMLPESLSARALSLHPGEERSALTVELRIDAEGEVRAVDVYESLLRSSARIDYDQMAAYLDRGTVAPTMEPVRAALPWLRTASARLGIARARRGGVRLDRDESNVLVDPVTGEATLELVPHNSAHLMIERFMVAANEAIAKWMHERGLPACYRVHPPPGPEAAEDLTAIAEAAGYAAGFARTLSPLALSAFDAQIAGSPSEPALRSVLLRALGPARYTVEPGAHFGLSAPLYLHFTSPLRRYADLLVHRVIKQYLRGRRDFESRDPALEAACLHINARSRAASRAEYDRRRMVVARIFTPRIGERFEARVTRVRAAGVMVQLDGSLAEGTVPLESLGEGPWRVASRETSASNRAGRTVTVGQAVTVKLVATDESQGRVEFALETAAAAATSSSA